MSSVFTFYIVRPDRTLDVERQGSVGQLGARWAQIEAKAHAIAERFEQIDRILGSDLLTDKFVGSRSLEETRALRDYLLAASPTDLALLEATPELSAAYWALRETTYEAVQRGATMIIESSG